MSEDSLKNPDATPVPSISRRSTMPLPSMTGMVTSPLLGSRRSDSSCHLVAISQNIMTNHGLFDILMQIVRMEIEGKVGVRSC